MPKKHTSVEIMYEEQDLEKYMSEFVAECCAERLLECYVHERHAELAALMADTPDVSYTLRLLIEGAIRHRLTDITTRAAAKKHQDSIYGKLRAQVLAFFHADAHRCDDRTGKPLYRSKSAFLEEVQAKLLKGLPEHQQSLTTRTMAGWLEEVRSEFPSHWPVRAD
jgi:hypothetical protein